MSENGPQIQLVYNEQAFIALLAEVAPNLDPAIAGDAEILEAVAYHWDIPVGALGGHQVTRPETGNILVAEKAVFGGDPMTLKEMHERTMQENFNSGCRECGGGPIELGQEFPSFIVGRFAFFNNGYLADWYAQKESRAVEERAVKLIIVDE